jgi:hypothetical protein
LIFRLGVVGMRGASTGFHDLTCIACGALVALGLGLVSRGRVGGLVRACLWPRRGCLYSVNLGGAFDVPAFPPGSIKGMLRWARFYGPRRKCRNVKGFRSWRLCAPARARAPAPSLRLDLEKVWRSAPWGREEGRGWNRS